ncbi:MAG TPA: hypothetical protein VJU86_12595 [Pyrinomonadaceae bacterium]|nr:hypothetical protein [Pyrinomonadaceae bacterium]
MPGSVAVDRSNLRRIIVNEYPRERRIRSTINDSAKEASLQNPTQG